MHLVLLVTVGALKYAIVLLVTTARSPSHPVSTATRWRMWWRQAVPHAAALATHCRHVITSILLLPAPEYSTNTIISICAAL